MAPSATICPRSPAPPLKKGRCHTLTKQILPRSKLAQQPAGAERWISHTAGVPCRLPPYSLSLSSPQCEGAGPYNWRRVWAATPITTPPTHQIPSLDPTALFSPSWASLVTVLEEGACRHPPPASAPPSSAPRLRRTPPPAPIPSPRSPLPRAKHRRAVSGRRRFFWALWQWICYCVSGRLRTSQGVSWRLGHLDWQFSGP